MKHRYRHTVGALVVLLLPIIALGQEPPARQEPPPEKPREDEVRQILSLGPQGLRHDDCVTAVAFSQDGRLLASGGAEGVAILWDAATGEEVRRFHTRAGGPILLCFPESSSLLVVDGNDAILRNPESGEVLFEISGEGLSSAGIGGKGKRLALGKVAGGVALWDLEKRQEIATVGGGLGSSPIVALSPDGRRLAMASEAASVIHLLDAETGDGIGAPLEGHLKPPWKLSFSPDGRFLVSIAEDARIWNLSNPGRGRVLRTGRQRERVAAFALSPDGRAIVLADPGRLRAWTFPGADPLGQITLRRVSLDGPSMTALAFGPDGHTLAAGGGDRKVTLWDTRENRRLLDSWGRQESVHQLLLSPDGRTLASLDRAGNVRLWDLGTGRGVRHWRVRMPMYGPGAGGVSHDVTIAFSPGGDRFAFVGPEGRARAWDVATGATIIDNEKGKPRGHWGAFGAVGDGLVMGWGGDPHQGGEPRLYDLSTGEPAERFGGRFRGSHGIGATDDGRILVVPSRGGLAIWDAAARRTLRTLKPTRGRLTAIAISPDGAHVACAVQHPASNVHDTTLQVWEVDSGAAVMEVKAHSVHARTLAFSPDGRWIASGGEEGKTRVWDWRSGRRLLDIWAHSRGGVTAVEFGADGRTLITGGDDARIHVWEIGGALPGEMASEADIATLVARLGSDDPGTADDAIRALAPRGDAALPAIREMLLAKGDVPVPEDLDRILDRIASSDPPTRDRAIREIVGLGDRARPVVKAALAKDPPADVRSILEDILDGLPPAPPLPGGESAAGLRAIRCLERIGTAGAVALLRERDDAAATGALARIEVRKERAKLRPPWEGVPDPAPSDVDQDIDSYLRRISPQQRKREGAAIDGPLIPPSLPATRLDREGNPLPPGAVRRLTKRAAKGADAITQIALSGDGRLLVTADWAHVIRTWDIERRCLLHTMEGHVGGINVLSLSPDRRFIASGSEDRTLRIWDAATGVEEGKWTFSGKVTGAAFSPDSRRLVAACLGRETLCLDVQTGSTVWQQEAFGGLYLSWLPDGSGILAQAWLPKNLLIIDPDTGGELRTVAQTEEEIQGATISPDGTILALTTQQGRLVLRSMETDAVIREMTLDRMRPWFPRFTPDGKQVVVGRWDEGMRIYDVSTGELRSSLKSGFQTFEVADLPGMGPVIVAPFGPSVAMWKFGTEDLSSPDLRFPTGLTPKAAYLSGDGREVILSSLSGDLRWIDLETGKETRRCRATAPFQEAPAPSPGGRWARGKGHDPSGRLWIVDLTRDDEAAATELREAGWNIRMHAFSPADDLLAISTYQKVQIWDPVRRTKLGDLDAGRDSYAWIAFSPDGKRIHATASNKLYRVWDVADQTLLHETDLGGYAHNLALSPDGALIAHVRESALFVRDAATGDRIREIFLGQGGGELRGFTGDSRFVLVGRAPAEFELWEVATGERRRIWTHGVTGRDLSVLLLPDGRRIATHFLGEILIWDILDGAGTVDSLDRAWETLGGEDAEAAHRAVATCVAKGDRGTSFLRERLGTLPSIPEDRIGPAIAALEADDFSARAAAGKELRTWGIRAEAALRAAMARDPGPESRAALNELLKDLEGHDLGSSGEAIRRWRAIEALEWIGSDAARKALQGVAGSSPSVRERRHATEALQRLGGKD